MGYFEYLMLQLKFEVPVMCTVEVVELMLWLSGY